MRRVLSKVAEARPNRAHRKYHPGPRSRPRRFNPGNTNTAMPPFYRTPHLVDRVQISRATRARLATLRHLIEQDDEPGGERLLFDPIDDRDRQCHVRRSSR